jgi:ubiquinone biosynthesis monooxygenase Coq7
MNPIRSSAHVLRVDHAGERGAIGIYRGQILVSSLLHRGCVPALTQMLAHERVHFATFDRLLAARGLRHCHVLPLWGVGGWALGVLTALCGERAIWVCTAAVESTVNAHLEHQVEFLREVDAEALAAVESIRKDEQAHEAHASGLAGPPRGLHALLWRVVAGSTALAIWLSTRL